MYLSQSTYVSKILKRFNIESAKPLSTILSMHVNLSNNEYPKSDDEKEFMRIIPYRFVVGSLMYAMVAMDQMLHLHLEL